MSSTHSPQQLPEAEKVSIKALERKIARLENQLKTERDGHLQQIESLEVAIGSQDEQLEQLQAALDNADMPIVQGDVKEIERLQSENKALKQKDTVGDGSNVLPAMEQKADTLLSELNQCKSDLAKSKHDLATANRQIERQKEMLSKNNAIIRSIFHKVQLEATSFRDIEAERIERFKAAGAIGSVLLSQLASLTSGVQDYVDAVNDQVSLDVGSLTKLEKACALPAKLSDASTSDPPLATQRTTLRTSGNSILQPSAGESSSSKKSGNVRLPEASPKTTLKDEAAEKGQNKIPGAQEPTDQDFTEVARSKSAPANRGPKQGSFEEPAATMNRFALLAEKGERTPKFSAQEQTSIGIQQPSPGSQSVNEDAEKRDQRADSAHGSSNAPTSFAAAHSTAWGPSRASAPAKAPADTLNRKHVFKPMVPNTKNAPTQSKTSFTPSATPFVPGSSLPLAQIAPMPPKAELEEFEALATRFSNRLDMQARSVTSRVPEKKISDAVTGEVAEPGKPGKRKPSSEDDGLGTPGAKRPKN